MSKIEWDESYSVNNKEIDEQHKEWIAIFNKLHVALLSDDPKSLDFAGVDSLKAMYDYAEYHFNFEEQYLSKINYPDLVAHRRLHKDFASKIYQYNKDINQGTIVLNTEIIKIIKDWLVEHILKEDKKYSVSADS